MAFDFEKLVQDAAQCARESERASGQWTIARMEVGQKGWTQPWAVFHDEEKNMCVLDGSQELSVKKDGTAILLVSRDQEGWHVDATQCFSYDPETKKIDVQETADDAESFRNPVAVTTLKKNNRVLKL